MLRKTACQFAVMILIAAFARAAAGAARSDAAASTDSAPEAVQSARVPGDEVLKALKEAADFDACDEYKPALEILTAAYYAGARDADLLEAMAVIELKTGLTADASKHLNEARSLYPSDARFLFWAAVAASAAGDDPKAARLLADGLAAVGDDEIALYDVAERLLRRGALGAASEIYRRITEIYPKDSQFDLFSVLHLAAYYGATRQYGKASELFKSNRMGFEYAEVAVLTAQECDYLGEHFRGLALIQAGDDKAGLNVLRDASARFPSGIIADGEIVKALDAAGRKQEADGVYAIVSRDLNEAVAMEPEKAEKWYYLAFFAAVTGRKSAEGLEAAQWALRLAPLRPEYLATRAAIYEAYGRHDEALVDLQRAMVLVSVPRWTDPGDFDEMMWRRLDLLEKTGKSIPAAFRRLPEPEAR